MNSQKRVFAVFAAMLAAGLCLTAPLSLPLGPLPLTLGTLGLFLIAGLLPPLYTAEAVGIYLLLGICGLPVFAGFCGGAAVLTGPTGGYLWGYLPAAVLASWISRRRPARWRYPAALVTATAIMYLTGTLWYGYTAQLPLPTAFLSGVVPFLPGDAVKIAVAALLCPQIQRRLPVNYRL